MRSAYKVSHHINVWCRNFICLFQILNLIKLLFIALYESSCQQVTSKNALHFSLLLQSKPKTRCNQLHFSTKLTDQLRHVTSAILIQFDSSGEEIMTQCLLHPVCFLLVPQYCVTAACIHCWLMAENVEKMNVMC